MIGLRRTSRAWEAEYDGWMNSDELIWTSRGAERLGVWLKRKTDRESRLRDIDSFIDKYIPTIKTGRKALVIDIGPGPGELLEIARRNKHDILGIDAESGEGGMGDAYLRVSQLMTQRQGVPVEYVGFWNWINEDQFKFHSSAIAITSRGSFEQAMSHLMEGPPHHEHQDCKRLRWKESGKTRDAFGHVMWRLYQYMQPGGRLLIHANGTASDSWYDTAISSAAREVGFTLEFREGNRLHRWVK